MFVRSFARSFGSVSERARSLKCIFFCLGKNESKAGQITRKEESVALRTQRAFVSSARCIVRFKWQSGSTALQRSSAGALECVRVAVAIDVAAMRRSRLSSLVCIGLCFCVEITTLRSHFQVAVVVAINIVAAARTRQTIAPLGHGYSPAHLNKTDDLCPEVCMTVCTCTCVCS